MLGRIIFSSIRYRLHLYLPILLAVSISLSLVGTAEVVGESFDEVVGKEMEKYGANVILRPEKGYSGEGLPLAIGERELKGEEVKVALTDVERLLNMNPAWVVKGHGELLVGREVAEKLNIGEGSRVELEGLKGRASILESGTEFDNYIFAQGRGQDPNLVLIKTEDTQRYENKNAIILEEMLNSKYSFLKSLKELILFVSAIAMLSSMGAIVNLARIDAGARSGEFGVFRALGAPSRLIALAIAGEFILLALAVGALGFLLSLAIGWAIMAATAEAAISFSFKALAYIFAASLLAFALASLFYIAQSKKEVAIQIGGE